LGSDGLRGSTLIAFCVASRNREATDADLRFGLARQVPSFAVPDSFHFLSELPKLPNGKTDRMALTALAERAIVSDS
jgi:acyl-coenzyme A synthetase/AMP-(fatty) acid ligase